LGEKLVRVRVLVPVRLLLVQELVLLVVLVQELVLLGLLVQELVLERGLMWVLVPADSCSARVGRRTQP
jgi:hypothetical protein